MRVSVYVASFPVPIPRLSMPYVLFSHAFVVVMLKRSRVGHEWADVTVV